MKNLFKNLMLVAVAAMAFTACQNDNSEVDTLPKTRVVTFFTNIGDDTRSGFTGKDGDGIYQSAWDGGESIILAAEVTKSTPTIDANGKFEQEFVEGDQFVSLYSPASSWAFNEGYNAYMPVVPATQTPRTNSVDPNAHILSAQSVYIGETGEVKVAMKHDVAYGKMTVNVPDFAIAKVVLNLKGSYYSTDKDLTYTLVNDGAIENNTFWFATEPLEISEFTIEAYDAEGNVMSKTVAAQDKLSFNYGRVSTFSVGNLTGQVEPALPAFTSAKMTNTNLSDKLVQFYSDELGTLQLNFYNCNEEPWLDAREYGFANSGDIYPGDSYSHYTSADDEFMYIVAGSVNVSIVDGQYYIEFNNLTDYDGSKYLTAVFKGQIEGLTLPDARTPLATPKPTATFEGSIVTTTWEAVENAVAYRVTCGDFVDEITTNTTFQFEVTQYTGYYVYVQALAATDDATYRDSKADYAYVLVEDPRQQLAAPQVTWEADGKTLKFSWEPVEGADYYRIYYYWNSNYGVTTTECYAEIVMDAFDTAYDYFCCEAKVNEDNTQYRDSYATYIYPKTGKDPDVLADYMYDTLSWNSTYSRFELTGGGNGMTQFYLNSADSPNHNSIKVGKYSYAGNTISSPAVGTFSLRYLLGSGAGSSHYINDAEMDVSFVDGEYIIIITVKSAGNGAIVGETFGFKGMPDWMVAPPAGDEGSDEEQIDLTGFTKMNLAGFSAGAADFVAKITFKDPVYSDEYSFSLASVDGISVANKVLATGEYTFVESFNSCDMEASDYYYIGQKQNATGKVTVYNQDGVYTIKCEVKIGYSTIKHYYQGAL